MSVAYEATVEAVSPLRHGKRYAIQSVRASPKSHGVIAVVAEDSEALGVPVLPEPAANLLTDLLPVGRPATLDVVDDQEDDVAFTAARARTAVVADGGELVTFIATCVTLTIELDDSWRAYR